MWRIIQRGILPALLLACGIASLTYGVKHHSEEVFVEQEIEISIEMPEMPMTAPEFGGEQEFGGEPGFDGPPSDMMFPGPPPEMQKVKQIVMIGQDDPEMVLVRDVTIGGLVLLPSGELQRTYTGKPPSLCPT